jgi:hypothetical protein
MSLPAPALARHQWPNPNALSTKLKMTNPSTSPPLTHTEFRSARQRRH